ncbi:hypothetical protein IV203_029149 [Nitzschia inconspicua]|uniref:Uncharacterized protein n=1 Tax=Nitzschia inconspicua TaxID=303405 RepID=A0A9K3PMP0_9STRA|nr:hypothetical protein IV203_008439 [Nitzschia inconspicua]KAG7366479.1 hypothetical protein IV203_029149 [Nitzschia inconspicua]
MSSRELIYSTKLQHHTSNQAEPHRQLAERGRLLDTVVSAASVVNKMLMENCGICTVYCDQQVKYEDWVQHQYHVSTSSLHHLVQKMNPNTPNQNSEIKQYQEFLFDEESVLESVASRDAEE